MGFMRQRVDGGLAELVRDLDRRDGWLLLLEGTPQSYVDLDDPTYLEFDYVRRLGHLADLVAGDGVALDVVHLGGGALTVARYIAATRPGSRQRVYEVDGPLADLVRAELPLGRGPKAGVRIRVIDAREGLALTRAASADLIVVDVFAGARTPAHLTTVEFYAQAARVLRPGGTLAVNVADGPPLGFVRAQAATVASHFARVALIADAAVLRGRRFGNVVLAASQVPLPVAALTRRTAGDSCPARVVTGDGLRAFTGAARPVTDATATASPAPPRALFGER
jgi:spermidine synthase